MSRHPDRLDCDQCPAFCCRMAGYVEVRRDDIRRLAKFLNLSVRGFEEKHVVETTRKGSKRIKAGYETCQFLSPERRCTVYAARPTDCRGYNCWEVEDRTVFHFARFTQQPVEKVRAKDLKDGHR